MNKIAFITLMMVSQISSASSLDKIIIGEWCEQVDGSGECDGYMTYNPGGSYFAHGKITSNNFEFESTGYWRLEGSDLCLTTVSGNATEVTSGDDLDLFPPAHRFCVHINSYDENEIIFSLSNGTTSKLVRVL